MANELTTATEKNIWVEKRSGRLTIFDMTKIEAAFLKATNNLEMTLEQKLRASVLISEAVNKLVEECIENDEVITTTEINETIEDILALNNYNQVTESLSRGQIEKRSYRKAASDKNTVNHKDIVENYLDESDWRVKENSTVTYSLGGLILGNSGALSANYWLTDIYDEEIALAHRNADMHIHDLSLLSGYCAGWNLKELITRGLGGVKGKISSAPPKHLSTLCNQIVNFLGIMQNEWAGAQAFSSFDTYLAPFVRTGNLSYDEVKQCIQSFVYGINTPSRWGCVDTDTEVLSVNGFKKYDELQEGDLIYTWNNGKLELNSVNKIVIKPHKGKMHSYNSKNYNQFVTPNHRVLYKKHNVDEFDIKTSNEIFDVATPYALPTMFNSSFLVDNSLTDEEIEIAAMIYTDGSIDLRNNNVHKVKIYKSPNRTGYDRIIECSNKLGLEYKEKETESGFGTSIKSYIFYSDSARKLVKLVETKKDISSKFLNMSQRQAELFLRTWASFDGNLEKFMLQYDNNLIRDKLQQIALLAGYTSYLREGKSEVNNKSTKYVKIRQNKTIYPTNRESIDYDGLVWCPSVDNGTAVFRKDGNIYISGQCQPPFTNITLDWTVPNDLAELYCVVGGEEQDFKYKDCKEEMDMINKAFIEIMVEGDYNGRGFQYPIPTYSITKDFDWSETENNKLLFEMTAKYGTPYFSNYVNSDMDPSDIRSMCCRLRLDLKELRRKSGGYFGSGESTGSLGVVTINLPRVAYLAKDKEEFYQNLKNVMDIAARSLKIKRDFVTKHFNNGLYPYTKSYLTTLDNHFSTIATLGMNEMCLNAKWIGDKGESLEHPEAQQFVKEVLVYMKELLQDYQEEYGDLYNLEAAPAESTAYRMAKKDVDLFTHIETAGTFEDPYYTNSSHLPVDYTEDVFSALDIQDSLQVEYTSGTVFHAFLGEKMPSWQSTAALVRKIAENYRLPYYTISPVYSICSKHGYISGDVPVCPTCSFQTEVYSRITGYYRPVKDWNKGKTQEYSDRTNYDVVEEEPEEPEITLFDVPKVQKILFTTETCQNCPAARRYLEEHSIEYNELNAADNSDMVKKYKVMKAPSLVVEEIDGSCAVYSGVGEILAGLENGMIK